MNLLWWLYCASLLFPRPASSTLTGSLPHFPEWLRTTLQWAGGTSPHSVWKLRVGGECNHDVEPKISKKREKAKLFLLRELCRFPTCLKGTRSSMCVQISVTAGEFPCLRGPVAGKSDRVRENCRQSTVKVCCNCWEIARPCSIPAPSALWPRRWTGAYLGCHWVKAVI